MAFLFYRTASSVLPCTTAMCRYCSFRAVKPASSRYWQHTTCTWQTASHMISSSASGRTTSEWYHVIPNWKYCILPGSRVLTYCRSRFSHGKQLISTTAWSLTEDLVMYAPWQTASRIKVKVVLIDFLTEKAWLVGLSQYDPLLWNASAQPYIIIIPALCSFTADTRRNNNVIMTSKRRRDVVLT